MTTDLTHPENASVLSAPVNTTGPTMEEAPADIGLRIAVLLVLAGLLAKLAGWP